MGGSVYPLMGGSVYPLMGGSVYPPMGGSVYPRTGGIARLNAHDVIELSDILTLSLERVYCFKSFSVNLFIITRSLSTYFEYGDI
jgi:hypothetical protein